MQSILNFSWGIWWSVLCNFEINKADINCKFIFHSYNKLDIVIAQPLLFCRHDGGGGITGVVSEGAGWLPRGQDQRHVLQLERRPGLLCPHTQIQASPHRLPQPRYQGLERVRLCGIIMKSFQNEKKLTFSLKRLKSNQSPILVVNIAEMRIWQINIKLFSEFKVLNIFAAAPTAVM